MVGHTLVAFVDNIMVGKLGTSQLAAISLGNSFIFLAMSFGIGFSTAITPLIAESNAKKNTEKTISKIKIKIKAKVGEGVKLFGSVNNSDISKELSVNGVELDKKSIIISGNNIKQLGSYKAKIRLHRDVIFEVPFDVVAEKK